MTLTQRKVAVKQLPQHINLQSGRAFYSDLEAAMNIERPCIVLDCSSVREMDQQTILILLNCLEGAMKRNGDVRLAAVSPEALRNLDITGVARLFRMYASVSEAVHSYQHRTATPVAHPQPEANAA